MFDITTKSIEWGGETLTLETGKVARQADGCVIATYARPASWPRLFMKSSQKRASISSR